MDDLSLIFSRGLRRGLLSLQRERSAVVSLTALLGILFLGQLLVLLAFTVQATENLLRARTDLRLEIRREATDQDVREFFAAIKELPVISDSDYITREQAYERERQRDPDIISFLEQYNLENPFPDTIAVTLRSLTDYDTFASFVRQARWSHIIDPQFLSHATDQEAQVRELISVASAGQLLISLFLGIVAVTILFVLVSLVRSRALARSDEVLLERLVGASTLSVLMPFITEATFLMLLGILGSTLLLLGFVFLLPVLVSALQVTGTFSALRFEVVGLLGPYLPLVLIVELFAAPLLGAIGAWLGMRGQLGSGGLRLAVA